MTATLQHSITNPKSHFASYSDSLQLGKKSQREHNTSFWCIISWSLAQAFQCSVGGNSSFIRTTCALSVSCHHSFLPLICAITNHSPFILFLLPLLSVLDSVHRAALFVRGFPLVFLTFQLKPLSSQSEQSTVPTAQKALVTPPVIVFTLHEYKE